MVNHVIFDPDNGWQHTLPRAGWSELGGLNVDIIINKPDSNVHKGVLRAATRSGLLLPARGSKGFCKDLHQLLNVVHAN